ncbi:MAG TPA: hypothetical protein VGI66_08530 [Streptosporangiaceae bacterium]
MSERRHASAGRHAVSARKSAGRMLLDAAVILVPLALFGLAVYWLTIATDVELYGAITLMWLATFIKAVVQRRTDRSFPWLAAAALLATARLFGGALAHQLHWPASQLHSVAPIGYAVDSAAAGCVSVGVVILIRTSALPWLRRRFQSLVTQPSGPGSLPAVMTLIIANISVVSRYVTDLIATRGVNAQ